MDICPLRDGELIGLRLAHPLRRTRRLLCDENGFCSPSSSSLKQSEGSRSNGGRGHQDGGFHAAGLQRRRAEKAVRADRRSAAAFAGAAEAAGANSVADSQSCLPSSSSGIHP